MRKIFFPLFLMLGAGYLFICTTQAAADNPEIGESSVPKATDLYQKGLAYYEKDFYKALDFFKQALSQDQNYINTLLEAGKMASLVSYFDEAQKYLSEAEKLLKNHNHTQSEKYTQYLYYMGYFYFLKEQQDSAFEYFEKARVLLESLEKQKTELYIRILVHNGFAYISKKQYDKALSNAETADALLAASNLPKINLLKYHTATLQGNVYCIKGQADLGQQFFNLAKSYLEKQGLSQSYDMAIIYNNLGWSYYLKNSMIHHWNIMKNQMRF